MHDASIKVIVRLLLVSIFLVAIGVPIVARAYEETDTWPCHWSYSSGPLYLYWKWQGYLVSPSNQARTNIKNAFSYSLTDWSLTDTAVVFAYDSGTYDNWLDSYYQQGGAAGYATAYCSGSTLLGNDVFKNEVGAESQSPSTVIRAATGHELGHAIGIGHGYDVNKIAIMGYNPDTSTYYVPQQDDEDAVNHYY